MQTPLTPTLSLSLFLLTPSVHHRAAVGSVWREHQTAEAVLSALADQTKRNSAFLKREADVSAQETVTVILVKKNDCGTAVVLIIQ